MRFVAFRLSVLSVRVHDTFVIRFTPKLATLRHRWAPSFAMEYYSKYCCWFIAWLAPLFPRFFFVVVQHLRRMRDKVTSVPFRVWMAPVSFEFVPIDIYNDFLLSYSTLTADESATVAGRRGRRSPVLMLHFPVVSEPRRWLPGSLSSDLYYKCSILAN
jgi:hypothetical protein